MLSQVEAGDDLAEMTAHFSRQATAQSQNLQRVEATLTTLGHNKEHARAHNVCATCARPFANKAELNQFIKKQVRLRAQT